MVKQVKNELLWGKNVEKEEGDEKKKYYNGGIG